MIFRMAMGGLNTSNTPASRAGDREQWGTAHTSRFAARRLELRWIHRQPHPL